MSEERQEEEKGLLKKLKSKVKGKIVESSAAKSFMETEEYKKIKEFRQEMKEFKENVKEEIDQTQNPFIQTGRDVFDVAFVESSTAKAIRDMQRYDPSFDI